MCKSPMPPSPTSQQERNISQSYVSSFMADLWVEQAISEGRDTILDLADGSSFMWSLCSIRGSPGRTDLQTSSRDLPVGVLAGGNLGMQLAEPALLGVVKG